MADRRSSSATRPFALVLAYGLAVSCWALLRPPVTPEEAQTILVGRRAMAREQPACGTGSGTDAAAAALDGLLCSYPGSVHFAPVAVARADALAGLRGARLLGALEGLALVAVVCWIGSAPSLKLGVLASAVFVLLGFPVQLAAAAHPRALAALLVGLSVALVESTSDAEPAHWRAGALALGGLALALGAIVAHAAALFAVPVLLLARFRHRPGEWSLFFLLPLLVALALYGWIAAGPAWPALREALELWRPAGSPAARAALAQIFERLAMPLLLATFGLFHPEAGKGALRLTALACGAFLLPLASAKAEAVFTAVLVAVVVLAPAAAVGVAQMARLFSSNNSMSGIRPFFVAAVLAVIGVFGVQEMKDLGANVVRLHLQVGKFMKQSEEPNEAALARLAKTLARDFQHDPPVPRPVLPSLGHATIPCPIPSG